MNATSRLIVGFGLLAALLAAHAQSAPATPSLDVRTIRAADLPRDAPRFEQFPATGQFHGRLAAPDVQSAARSRLFRTMIRDGAKSGPNFAAHYTIVRWGCGAACAALAIVDANTGAVYHPRNLRVVDSANIDYAQMEKPDGHLIKYRLDSRLLIVVGAINEDSALRGISYFVWEHQRLRRISFVHRP